MASVVGALIFFLLYFPYMFVTDSGASVNTKLFASLSPPVALSIGAGLIAQLESAGEGVRFSTLNEMIDNSSMAQVLAMLLIDTLLYAGLAWYLDKVLVVGFGTRERWFFPCTRQYWRPQTSVMSESELQDLEQGFDDAQPPSRHEAVPASMSEQRSILVRSLCKDFKAADGKTIHAAPCRDSTCRKASIPRSDGKDPAPRAEPAVLTICTEKLRWCETTCDNMT
ncbi:Abca3 [Symbiodinium sp. CCMP2592]|nr:Abca3 [Symbiodinium sp. CCMP2592]